MTHYMSLGRYRKSQPFKIVPDVSLSSFLCIYENMFIVYHKSMLLLMYSRKSEILHWWRLNLYNLQNLNNYIIILCKLTVISDGLVFLLFVITVFKTILKFSRLLHVCQLAAI